MKTLKLILCAVILLGATTAFGQSYVFKVLANKGENQVKSGATWETLKTGTALKSGETVKISENGYVGLVHASGRTVELNSAKQVTVDDLAAELKVQSVGVASRYAEFVLNKLAEADDVNNLRATGAVERGEEGNISVMLPKTSEVLNSEAIVEWKAVDNNPVYLVTLKNQFDEELMVFETEETTVKLDLADAKLAKERLLILKVGVKGDDATKSIEYGIKRMTGSETTEIQANLDQLSTELGTESSLGQVMMASFFEQNNLLVDASTSYQKAMELSPEVTDFRRMYEAFVERNNLK